MMKLRVDADLDAEQLDAAAQPRRQRDELLLRPHGVVDRRHRHEDEADGEEHLVEMVAVVEPHVQRALQQDADERRE